jgi:SPIRAL1-like protein
MQLGLPPQIPRMQMPNTMNSMPGSPLTDLVNSVGGRGQQPPPNFGGYGAPPGQMPQQGGYPQGGAPQQQGGYQGGPGQPGQGAQPYAAQQPDFAHGNRQTHGSNSYANGASQNTGNFVTDRATTRVSNPPGGSSSFSIGGYGGYGDAGPPQQTGRRSPQKPPIQQGGYGAPQQGAYGGQQGSPPQQQGGAQYAHGNRQTHGSNSYANGASQNTGNFITDRATTRVSNPPGGGSSFSIGGYGGAPEVHASTGVRGTSGSNFARSASPIATRQDQGQGAMGGMAMQGQRAMQGGMMQGGMVPPQQQQQQQGQQQQSMFQGANGAMPSGQQPGQGGGDFSHGGRLRQSSNSYATGSHQNTGNFITERSSTRIHAPPGGGSSISFG